MLNDIYLKYSRRIFFPNHKARSVQINLDGTFTTIIEKYTYEVIPGQGNGSLNNFRFMPKM